MECHSLCPEHAKWHGGVAAARENEGADRHHCEAALLTLEQEAAEGTVPIALLMALPHARADGRNRWCDRSVAGDADFDPLNLATDLGVTDRYELQVAEILNGRLAMLAVAAYTMIEASGTRVVDARWWF